MPYTPPAQLSPATSKQSTPRPSRSASYVHHAAPVDLVYNPAAAAATSAAGRPQLPRSAGSSSYLTKHRRSPSTPTGNELPEAMTDEERGITFDPYGSIRQSPPPAAHGLMPAGMTISPPESSHNSDDEEMRGRTRELQKGNWAELETAVRGIQGQRGSGSPTRTVPRVHTRRLSQSEGSSPADDSNNSLPLSGIARKMGHARNHSDSNLHKLAGFASPRTPDDLDDTSDSEASLSRPPMVRKKSGELVKPALRPQSRRRPSSMPGTPTYSKAVHFDSQLEHVRHFLQVDRPLAVSAGSSPAENYESETEFPFGSDEASARSRTAPLEWEIKLANFPPESPERKWQPVHVERIFLSADNKHLVGIVAVQNLAFGKAVTARFTLDYWKTTSEVAAEYSNDIRRTEPADGLDRFSFSITLADQANLENKTLFFCARYNVNGQEYWDSNNGMNYQVDFARKAAAVVGSAGASSTVGGRKPSAALPRSRPSPPVSAGRPKSMPISFDDFGTGGFDNFGVLESPTVLIGEPKIKLRSPRSKSDLTADTPLRRNKSAAPVFGHRYDFNSSLSAAKNTAYAVLGDQSGFSSVDAKQSVREVPALSMPTKVTAPVKLSNGLPITAASLAGAKETAPATSSSKPAALLSDKPALSSQSYQELVDKYCFFGAPKVVVAPKRLPLDGTTDSASPTETEITGSQLSSGAATPRRGLSSTPPTEAGSPEEIESVKISFARASSPRSFACNNNSRSNSPAFGRPSLGSQTLVMESPRLTAIRS